MTMCNHDHRHDEKFKDLPHDQGGFGRHKCAACAYDRGYQEGLARSENLIIDLDSLPETQAGVVRHKSPHAGYAQGYFDGIRDSY